MLAWSLIQTKNILLTPTKNHVMLNMHWPYKSFNVIGIMQVNQEFKTFFLLPLQKSELWSVTDIKNTSTFPKQII